MYYHWNLYVRRLSLLSAFEDTPVVPFVSSRVVIMPQQLVASKMT
jgi:hypothetical protein